MPKLAKAEDAKILGIEIVEEKPLPKILVRPVKEKRYSFEQWAKLRNKPARHLGGLRAFLGNRAMSKFSLQMWDEIFKAY